MRVVPCGDIDAIQTKLMLFFFQAHLQKIH